MQEISTSDSFFVSFMSFMSFMSFNTFRTSFQSFTIIPPTMQPTMQPTFIPPHGGYKKLLSYQKSLIVYEATIRFCERFIRKGDRTCDQMVQAARSGKQNIVEGSMASATSKEMEIKLTNVARASLEELLEDYRDFLLRANAEEWSADHPHAKRFKELNRKPEATYASLKTALEHNDPAVRANTIILVITLTTYLLDRQLRHLERQFTRDGGLRERMTRARLQSRGTTGKR